VCFKYPDIEQRIARVTDSARTIDDIYSALNNPLAARETRMEVVAWIAVCQFDCRISGGFVRDWIVGGYSSRPSSDIDPTNWITYIHYEGSRDVEKRIPQLNKEFVPNDLDCILPGNGFDMEQFQHCLRRHGFQCKAACNLDRGYLLVLDEHRLPFTVDLISSDMASVFQRYSIVDMDVNNLCIGKDYKRALGMRSDLTRSNLMYPITLETIVENIKQKHFTVLRKDDIKNRVEKMVERGWTQVEAKASDESKQSVDEPLPVSNGDGYGNT
jgi:hypothetical protein